MIGCKGEKMEIDKLAIDYLSGFYDFNFAQKEIHKIDNDILNALALYGRYMQEEHNINLLEPKHLMYVGLAIGYMLKNHLITKELQEYSKG